MIDHDIHDLLARRVDFDDVVMTSSNETINKLNGYVKQLRDCLGVAPYEERKGKYCESKVSSYRFHIFFNQMGRGSMNFQKLDSLVP